MANQVITKACIIQHADSTGEHMTLGQVLVNPTTALLAEVTAGGGLYRAAAIAQVNAREILGENGGVSNASL